MFATELEGFRLSKAFLVRCESIRFGLESRRSFELHEKPEANVEERSDEHNQAEIAQAQLAQA